jgi:hypothetical protein
MVRTAVKCVLVLLLVLFVTSLTPLGRASIAEVPFGWFHFIGRTLPNMTFNWSGIGMVVLCSAVVLFVLQRFLSWLYLALAPSAERPSAWQWRWTLALYAFFWILFGIVMGASGVMRQTTWLIHFSEPLYKPRLNGYVELRHAAGEVETALLESGGDIRQAQKLLTSFRRDGAGAWDYHQFLFLTNGTGSVDVVIIPRDPEIQRKAGFALLADDKEQHLPITNLLTLLRGRVH